ncbi:cation diffusion facilitator family transporter [Lutibaculum baratangense]|nr:cation diffusion facilitator family transporter [Lutibaculum baratangense]
MRRAIRAAWCSVFIGIVVLLLKTAAWWITGSIALYSDALESIINVAAAFAALVALHYASKPADSDHPYGHHKAEYFSAVIEGVLIVLAALSIMREAYLGFLNPTPIDAPVEGMALNALATIINLLWARYLITRGRRWSSPAVTADGRHLMADVVTSIGVLAGLALVPLTGFLLLDPLLAALVSLNVLWTGWQVMKESVGGLMDAAPAPETLERIRQLISENAGGAQEAHDLRTRHAGRMTFIEFHLVVPSDMTVEQAHEICDKVESALREEMEEAMISIHVEPAHKAKQQGVLVL